MLRPSIMCHIFPSMYCCVFVPGHQQSSRHTVGISRTEPVSRPPGHRSLLLLLRRASLDFLLFYYMTYMWCSDSLLLYTVLLYDGCMYTQVLSLSHFYYSMPFSNHTCFCVTLLILLDKSAWCKESLNDTVWRSSHVYGAWVRCVLYCCVVQGSGRRIPVGKPRTHTATPLRHWNGVQGKPDENRDLYAGP